MISVDPTLVELAISRAIELSTHSWEQGTLAEALLEWHDPALSVFGRDPFPGGRIPSVDPSSVRSLAYAKPHIRLDSESLADGNGTAALSSPPATR